MTEFQLCFWSGNRVKHVAVVAVVAYLLWKQKIVQRHLSSNCFRQCNFLATCFATLERRINCKWQQICCTLQLIVELQLTMIQKVPAIVAKDRNKHASQHSLNLSRNAVVTQIARKIALCNLHD